MTGRSASCAAWTSAEIRRTSWSVTPSRESVIPGIAAEDFRGIFEVHKLVVSRDPSMLETNAFDTTSKVFSFGPILANLSGDEEAEAEAEPVLDDNGEPLPKLPTGGVKANFRISNPKKVPCSVDLTLAQEEDGAATAASSPSSALAARHPAARAQVRHGLLRPTRDLVVFRAWTPSCAMARIPRRSSSPASSATARCRTRGRGADIAERTVSLVKFPKMLLGRKMTKPIVLRNNGILPAVLRAEMMTHKHFSIEGGVATPSPDVAYLRVTLDAGKTRGTRTASDSRSGVPVEQTVSRRSWLHDDVMFADLPGTSTTTQARRRTRRPNP